MMKTNHKILNCDSRILKAVETDSVDLVVTSPPYPMIEMWDDVFSSQDPEIGEALKKGDGPRAFELMNIILDAVWSEAYRVLKQGGFACINIGDATRTINGEFSLYPNHARILSSLIKQGFRILPEILWRKQTNAPNKFMGSGMLPAGAYVTLEHEFVLVARKGGKREFTDAGDKENRRQSAFFWEERNTWFSDVWMDLKGVRQNTNSVELRKRSGAFPLELPFRLISMYSAKGDTVLDPFGGLGSTMWAAAALARNSVTCEIDPDFCREIINSSSHIPAWANERIKTRLNDHIEFAENRFSEKGPFKYRNENHGFPVITRQETALSIETLKSVSKIGDDELEAEYSPPPKEIREKSWDEFFQGERGEKPRPTHRKRVKKTDYPEQGKIFE